MAVDSGVVIRLARSGPNIQIQISEESSESAIPPPVNPEFLENEGDSFDPVDRG
jgi:hypothetical protein